MILILTGVSGAGKSAIANRLKSQYGFTRIQTVTSRSRRLHERKDEYHFVTPEEFKRMNLVCIREHGQISYGVPCMSYEDKDYVIVLDPRGAVSFKSLIHSAYGIDCYIIEIEADAPLFAVHARLKRRGIPDYLISEQISNDLAELANTPGYTDARLTKISNNRKLQDVCNAILNILSLQKGVKSMNIIKTTHPTSNLEDPTGQSYILTIESAYIAQYPDGPAKLYKVEGFNSLVFDERGLSKLTKYEPPAADTSEKVEEAENELYSAFKHAVNMSSAELDACFFAGGGTDIVTLSDVLEHCSSPAKFVKRIKEWIVSGDEVEIKSTGEIGTVVDVINNSQLIVIVGNNDFRLMSRQDVNKTGNHVSISITTAASTPTPVTF